MHYGGCAAQTTEKSRRLTRLSVWDCLAWVKEIPTLDVKVDSGEVKAQLESDSAESKHAMHMIEKGSGCGGEGVPLLNRLPFAGR